MRRIVDIDDDRLCLQQGERFFDDRRVLEICYQHFGVRMTQHEGDRFRVEPGVQRV
jgi:hypothetical protein